MRLVLGRPRVCPGDFTGFVAGTNPVKTWVFSLFYTEEARQTLVCPWDKPSLSLGHSRGRKAAQKAYVKKVYVPFSLAIFPFLGLLKAPTSNIHEKVCDTIRTFSLQCPIISEKLEKARTVDFIRRVTHHVVYATGCTQPMASTRAEQSKERCEWRERMQAPVSR